jgi:hypothetical protein
MILAERAARASDAALIAHLELEIQKLRRTLYGPSSERKARLLDQLELQLEELAAAATEDRRGRDRMGHLDTLPQSRLRACYGRPRYGPRLP